MHVREALHSMIRHCPPAPVFPTSLLAQARTSNHALVICMSLHPSLHPHPRPVVSRCQFHSSQHDHFHASVVRSVPWYTSPGLVGLSLLLLRPPIPIFSMVPVFPPSTSSRLLLTWPPPTRLASKANVVWLLVASF